MSSYYQDNFYSNENTINYNNISLPEYTPDQQITNQNNYLNTITYTSPSNQYINQTLPYLTEIQNSFYTPQSTNKYNINYNYQNYPIKKEYQTSTAYNYRKGIQKIVSSPIKRYFTKTSTYNNQQIKNQRFNTIDTIQRTNTLVQRPKRNLLNNLNNDINFNYKRNYSNDYRFSDAIKYENQQMNNIKVVSKGNDQQELYNNVYYNNFNQENNIVAQVQKEIIDEDAINKENDKAFNELMNITNNNNQITTENIYDTESYITPKYQNTTTFLTNGVFTNSDIPLLDNEITTKKNYLSQSVHFPSKVPQINNEFYLNENFNNNALKKEGNNNTYLNNQLTNNNQLIYNNDFNNYNNNNNNNYNYNYNTNNSYFDINEFLGTTQSQKNIFNKTNQLQQINQINQHQKIVTQNMQKENQSSSKFIKNINGEITNDDNSHQYYRKLDGNLIKSYGYCQNQGRRPYMEDEGKVIEYFNGDSNKILFGLFDGHGGGQVSKFLQKNIGNYMKKILDLDEANYIKNFTKLFFSLDKDIDSLNIPTVGSTGTVVFIEKKDNKKILYCANVGDSRCILVSKNKVTRLSHDDRVADDKERQRVLDGNGIIIRNRVGGILMLTRSFGDFITKSCGVIIIPHVARVELSEDDVYCVIASDGVWDVLKDEELSVLIKLGLDSGELSRRTINESLKRRSKDNLSCFIINLN